MNNKYLKIYNELAEKIESGIMEPDTKLPSENQLASRYDSSRGTIRKALNLLAQNGYIQKVKGKGSFVLDTKKFEFPVSGVVSFKELSPELGSEANTIVSELDLIEADACLQSKLNLSDCDKVWKLVRVREIGGQKIILDKDFLKQEFVPSLTKEIGEDSIYEHIEEELGLKIGFAKKMISVEEASVEDKDLLDLKDYDLVVVVRSYTYLDDASLFQYTESRHRPDKFKFVDFARRKHQVLGG